MRLRAARQSLCHLILVAQIAPLALVGCKGADGLTGLDGQDGNAYSGVTWAYVPEALWMSDPALPTRLTKDRYYRTYPGRYEFSYKAWDGSIWGGEYRIYVNPGAPGLPGEPGGWFWQKGVDGPDGADGADLYFLLGLWSTGPELYVKNSPSNSPMAAPAQELAHLDGFRPISGLDEGTLRRQTIRPERLPEARVGPVVSKVAVSGHWRVDLQYWRVLPNSLKR